MDQLTELTLKAIDNAIYMNKLGRLKSWISVYRIEEQLDKRINADTIAAIVEVLDEVYNV